MALHALDEPGTEVVLTQLHLEADDPHEHGGTRVLAPSLQDSRHALLGYEFSGADAVHHDVAVTLEQGHQCLDSVDHFALGRRRKQPKKSRIVHQGLTGGGGFAQLLGDPAEPPRLRHRGVDELGYQTEEIVTHPRDSQELEAMGALVERNPEAKLIRTKLVLAFHEQDVGANEHHSVTVIPVSGRQHQLILPEHSPRQEPQHRSEFGSEQAAADPGSDSGLLAQTLLGRGQQAAK